MNKKELTLEVIKRLEVLFPEPKIALNFGNEFELLVAVILSAQCTDERVNKVTPKVFARFKSVKDFAECDINELEKLIFSTGFYRAKARNIRGAAQIVVEKFGGSLPRTMKELLELPGVARKTANVVLHTKLEDQRKRNSGKTEKLKINKELEGAGIAVDTHVARVAGKLGLVSKKDSEAKAAIKIENALLKLVPKKYWGEFTHLLILHGRKTCIARRPKCAECALSNICTHASKVPLS